MHTISQNEILDLAEQYLIDKQIKYIKPGRIGIRKDNQIEVIFLDPQTLDPKVAVVEPEDIRVWVNTKTKEVTLIWQM